MMDDNRSDEALVDAYSGSNSGQAPISERLELGGL